MTTLEFVPIDLIDPHPSNPRRDLGDLTEMVDSIKAQGIRQPLLLVLSPNRYLTDEEETRYAMGRAGLLTKAYRVIIGHRRLAAARLAGLDTVPAIVDPLLSEVQQVELMLVENVQRSDLSPVEEAEGYQQLLDLGVTIPAIVKTTGRSKTTITGRLRLLKLPDDAREKLHARQATLEDAAKLAEFSGDPETIEQLSAALGTTNFAWRVDRAREAARTADKQVKLAAKLTKKGLTQLADEPARTDYVTVETSYSLSVPKDLQDATHFRVTPYYLYLYRATTQAERDKWDKSAAAKARKQARDEAAAIEQQKIVAECETAERLRAEFIRGRVAMAKMTAHDRQQIVTAATRLLFVGKLEIRSWDVSAALEDFVGHRVEAAEWLDAYTGTPEALLLLLIHLKHSYGKWSKPQWRHAAQSAEMVALYRLLDELGYPISDAERARVFPLFEPDDVEDQEDVG